METDEENQNVFSSLKKLSDKFVLRYYTTHILVAADFFESTKFINEWSTVFLPLRGQVHYPLGTSLHQSLEEETHRFPQLNLHALMGLITEISFSPPT